MRQITKETIAKFMSAEQFKKGHDEVIVRENVTVLKLFGNEIAYRYNNPDRTLSITHAGWDSVTTKERLNGIPGVSISQKKGAWYLNGYAWDGKLIDIN
jgi:hypothetical protein